MWVYSFLILIGALLIIDMMGNGWIQKIWLDAAVIIAMVFSLIEIALASLWYAQAVEITGQTLSTLPFGYRSSGLLIGHANVFSGFLNLIIIIMWSRLLTSTSLRSRSGIIFILGILTITQFLTSSRGGWLSGIAGVSVTTGFYFIRVKSVHRHVVALLRSRAGIYLLIGIVVVFGVAGYAIGSLLLRQVEITPGHAPIANARSGIWVPSFEMFRESPIIGNGNSLGSFSTLFAQKISAPPGFASSHAHNLLLQIAVQSGFVGLCLALLFGIIISLDLINQSKERAANDINGITIAIGGTTAFLIHHLVDYLLESPIYAFTLVMIIAFVMHRSKSSFIEIPLRRVRNLVIPLLLVGVAPVIYSFFPSAVFWRGVNAFRANNLFEASTNICRAAEMTNSGYYLFQCGLSQAYLYEEQGDPTAALKMKEYLQRGLSIDAGWPIHEANFGAILFHSGEIDEGILWLEEALTTANRHPSLWLNFGRWNDIAGQVDIAHAAVQNALAIDPLLYRADIFQRNETWLSISDAYYQAILDASSSNIEYNGWRAFDSDNYSVAEKLFEDLIQTNPLSTSGYLGLSEVYLALGRFSEAEATIRIGLFLDPANPYSYDIQGRIMEATENESEAMDKYQLEFHYLTHTSDSWSYYARTYSQFFPEPDLVPQLIRFFPTTVQIESLCKLASYYNSIEKKDASTKIQKYLNRLIPDSACDG
jgi:O-antigen ligase